MTRRCFRWTGWALMLSLTLVATGCGEEVNSVLGTEGNFSLYGVLKPEADTQWIRVFPVEGELRPERPEPIQARLTSEAFDSGEERVWRDTVLQRPGEDWHLFWAAFRPQYGQTYRLTVEGADDETSRVRVTVPIQSTLNLQSLQDGPTQPVFVRGATSRLLKVRVRYRVRFRPRPNEGSRIADVFLPYDDRKQQTENGWRVPVNMSQGYEAVRDSIGVFASGFGIKLVNITMRLIVANEAWDPVGNTFDPEVLSQPGTLTNVEQGFGFVGAGYQLQRTWRPNEEIAQLAGFKELVDAD